VNLLCAAARHSWPSPATPSSQPAAAAPDPHPRLIPSPSSHPRTPTLRILANPSNGLGGRRRRVEYGGARAWHRAARLASGWDLPLVYIVNLVEGHAWPSPAASKVDAACELRHPVVRCSAGVFLGLHCGREARDTAVCAPPLSPTADAPLQELAHRWAGRPWMRQWAPDLKAGLGASSTCRTSRQSLPANAAVQRDLVSIKVYIFSCFRSNRFLARYPISHQNGTNVTYLEQLAGRGALVGEQLNNLPNESRCCSYLRSGRPPARPRGWTARTSGMMSPLRKQLEGDVSASAMLSP
jgi:hypothetical protein